MDEKLKHLEFIQGVINRLSANSFLLKGWSVVLLSALIALAAHTSNVAFIFSAFIPVLVFWGLDGYFIAVEREYREHYERVRALDPDKVDLSMDVSDLSGGMIYWVRGTLSKTLVPFHGALVLAIVIVMYLTK